MIIDDTPIPEMMDPTHTARVWDVDGIDLVQADFDGSDVDIFVYTEDGTLAYTLVDQAIAGYLSDTLTTGGRWGDKDTIGYNFTFTLSQVEIATGPLSERMQGGRKYRTVYVLKTTSKGEIPLVFLNEIVPVKPV